MTATDSDLGSGIDEAALAAAHEAPSHTDTAKPGSVFGTDQAIQDSAQSSSVSGQTGQSPSDDLLTMKQAALKELSPLVSHLEQTPEEKFRTTMMMIQASDDQTLLKTAYEAAQAIKDEKAKAQALLDIVNEINYFTQHHSS